MTLIIALTVVSTPGAQAEDNFWYAGLGLGQADDRVLEETDSSWKVYAGYQVNKYLGFEVGYVDLGDYFFDLLSQTGLFLEATGSLPLGQRFAVFAKAGALSWSVKVPDLGSETGTDGAFGLGVKYSVKSIILRLEFERFLEIAGGDVDLLSMNVAYRF